MVALIHLKCHLLFYLKKKHSNFHIEKQIEELKIDLYKKYSVCRADILIQASFLSISNVLHSCLNFSSAYFFFKQKEKKEPLFNVS